MVQLIKNGKNTTSFVPSDGCLNLIEENVKFQLLDLVKDHSVGDIPGVCFKIVKVARVCLLALYKGRKEKSKTISFFSKIVSFDGESVIVINF